MLESTFADIRFALRWLIKSPGFAAVAVVSLAIGIGFNTALYAIVDGLLLRPIPVVHPEQLVDAYTSSADAPFGTSSYPDYLDLRARNGVFADLVGYSPMFGALTLGDRSRLTLGEVVTGNYFPVLGAGAAAGRTLVPDDDRPAAPRVAMISYQYWMRELAGAPTALGRTLTLRGNRYTIVGVAPRGFNGMNSILSPDLWVPMAAATEVEPIGLREVVPSPTGTTRLDRRGERWLFMKGRLKPGVAVEQARANLDVLMAQLETENPVTNKDRRIAVRATRDVRFHPALDSQIVPIAALLMAIVGLVLVIACANVASMLLARASGRQKEIGMRLALGATRGRLVRQLVTETFVLSVLGAAAGILLAWWITQTLESISLPTPLPLAFDLRIDARVLLFTLAATFAAGLLAGLVPALKASRPNLVAELRGEAIASEAGGRRWTLGDLLVVLQVSITAALLVLAALLTRSVLAAERANVGFAADRLALVSTDTSMLRYTDVRSRQFYAEALARLRSVPGVESVALATRPPFSMNYNFAAMWIPGRHRPGDPGENVEVTRVSGDYFRTMGVALRQGRVFNDGDRPDTPRVAVVNDALARRFWPGESAIGKTFYTRGGAGPLFTIVGVVADHTVKSVGETPTPFLHVASSQQPNSYNAVIARTRGDAGALLRDMRRELLALEPNLVFVENQTMQGEMATTLFPVRAGAWLVSIVGLVAMLLAAVGLYGVIAYSVARRTREIGIRMALGAQRSWVLGSIMRRGLAVAVAGLVVGYAAAAVLAVGVGRTAANMLYGVGAADPVSWIGAAAVLLGVSALANLIPARRAAHVEPSEALRVE